MHNTQKIAQCTFMIAGAKKDVTTSVNYKCLNCTSVWKQCSL